MERSLIELLHALREAVRNGYDISDIEDDIDYLAEFEPESSRADALAYTGDPMGQLWALGKIGDPRDFERFVAALDDPQLRATALEGLGQQPDLARVDAVVRPLLQDPDPDTRHRAVGVVSWCRQPGAVQALAPFARDPNPRMRWMVAFQIGRLDGAEPLLRMLLEDPDPSVRNAAAFGMRQWKRRHPG